MCVLQLKLHSDHLCFTRTKQSKSPDNRATTSQQHFGERNRVTHLLFLFCSLRSRIYQGGVENVNFDHLAFSSNDKVRLACCSSPQTKQTEGNSHCGCSTTFCQ